MLQRTLKYSTSLNNCKHLDSRSFGASVIFQTPSKALLHSSIPIERLYLSRKKSPLLQPLQAVRSFASTPTIFMSSTTTPTWSRLVRFLPPHSTTPLIGEPVDANVDVGLAMFDGTQSVEVEVYEGKSVLTPGEKTGQKEVIGRLLSPVTEEEVGSIRCIGLNYLKHAKEAGLDVPTVPILFLKPSTSLTGPYPAPIVIPKFTIESQTADYESELGVILGKDCKDVSEANAMDYVLGYTATNDVSSRKSQFEQSQWCFSKGFDKACPVGPVLVSPRMIPDPSKLYMRGLKNGKVMQESGVDDLVFSIPKLISFLSQGTTLKAGTLILTGTPHGIGFFYKPPEILRDGDTFSVEVSGGIGTLINKIEYEK